MPVNVSQAHALPGQPAHPAEGFPRLTALSHRAGRSYAGRAGQAL